MDFLISLHPGDIQIRNYRMVSRVLKTNRIIIVRLTVAGIILCSGLFAFATLSEGTDWDGDFASYIMQAQNILEGSPQKFIEANRFTIEESLHKIGPVAYPWGTPLLLSLFIALFGMNILALKALNLVCYLLFLIVLWSYARSRLSVIYSLGLVSIFAFNPLKLFFLNHIMSDIPFLLFSTLTLYFIGRIAFEKEFFFSPIVDRLLLGVLLAFSFFIRTNGILLCATLLSTHAIILIKGYFTAGNSKMAPSNASRRPKSETAKSFNQNIWVNLLPYAVFISLTVIWRFYFPSGGSSHLNYLQDVTISTITRNTRYYIEIIPTFFSRVPFSNLLYGATLPFLFMGMIQCRLRDFCVIVYSFFTLILYIIWPMSDQGLRFLFPILPFYLYFVFIGLEFFVRSFRTPRKRLFVQTSIILLLFFVAAYFAKSVVAQAANNIKNQRYEKRGAFSNAATDVFSFIKENTASGDILIFRKPRVMRLRTGRQAITTDISSAIFRADYLCYDTKTSHLQLSLAEKNKLVDKKQLRHIYSNEVFRLYRIIKPQKMNPKKE